MKFIALLMAVFAVYGNVKGYERLFKDKEKFIEETRESMEKNKNELDEKGLDWVYNGFVTLIMLIAGLCSIFYFAVTASIVGGILVPVLAVVITIINIKELNEADKMFKSLDFRFPKLNFVTVPLNTIYIALFLYHFFFVM